MLTELQYRGVRDVGDVSSSLFSASGKSFSAFAKLLKKYEYQAEIDKKFHDMLQSSLTTGVCFIELKNTAAALPSSYVMLKAQDLSYFFNFCLYVNESHTNKVISVHSPTSFVSRKAIFTTTMFTGFPMLLSR